MKLPTICDQPTVTSSTVSSTTKAKTEQHIIKSKRPLVTKKGFNRMGEKDGNKKILIITPWEPQTSKIQTKST